MGRPVGEFIDSHLAATKWDHYAECGYSVQGECVDELQNFSAESKQGPPVFRRLGLST
jgi:hypothetical protein